MHTLGGLRGNQVASFTEIGRDLRSFCSRASALFSLGTKRVNRDVAILLISDLKRSPLWKKKTRHLVESKECFDCSLVLQVSGLDSNVKIQTDKMKISHSAGITEEIKKKCGPSVRGPSCHTWWGYKRMLSPWFKRNHTAYKTSILLMLFHIITTNILIWLILADLQYIYTVSCTQKQDCARSAWVRSLGLEIYCCLLKFCLFFF